MSKTLINVVLDLETLSTRENAAIIQIGCCIPEFDRVNVPAGILPEFEVTIAYEDCLDVVELGVFHQEASTMSWWQKQNPQVRKYVFSGQNSYYEALDQLEFWFSSLRSNGADIAVYGNGSDFDNRLLAYALQALNYKPTWNFKNNRDLRTMRHLFPCKIADDQSEIKHTALGDARYEARLLNEMYKTYPYLQGVL
jgi:exodeoxyribonuclease VIII